MARASRSGAGPSGSDAPAAGGNAFPFGYSDPVFTGMSNLSPGEIINNKQVADDSSGNQTIDMGAACTINYCRMVTREGPRLDAGSNDVCALNWCYVENYNVPGDHSDGCQAFGAGGSPKPILRLRNCQFKNLDGHTAIFGADAVQVGYDIEDCLITGGGQFGLRLHDDIGGGAITLRMKNVYFTDTFTDSAIFINLAVGTNPVVVTLWENVRWCTFDGVTLTPGALIDQPAGT
jgi:hypothetical protein